MQDNTKPCMGAGLGLRSKHVQHVISSQTDVPWFEIHVCNYLYGSACQELLAALGDRYPLSFHSVSLNIAGVDALNTEYLELLAKAERQVRPALISDHLCFTAFDQEQFHDLLPIPYTEEALQHVAERIRTIQDVLQRQILIENISQYSLYQESELSEALFLNTLCSETGCGILLDVNNCYVNAYNHQQNVEQFLDDIDFGYVKELHLGGHEKQNHDAHSILIDTHDQKVSEDVWRLYEKYAHALYDKPCLIEWDNALPEFGVLEAQRCRAQAIIDNAIASRESYAVV